MAEALAAVADLLQKGEVLVLVRVISSLGSTPREAGARMIVRKSGEIIGTIGGGQVEAKAVEIAKGIFQSRANLIGEADLTYTDATADGMICGGRMRFFCEYVPADKENLRIFGAVKDEHADLKKVVLCTELSESLETVKRFILQEDLHDGSSVSPAITDLLRKTGRSATGAALVEGEGGKWLVEVIASPAALYIFGAGHVAREVAALAANVGFRAVVMDDRPEFADPSRFPAQVEVRPIDSFTGCFSGLGVDEKSFIVIVTRGHAHDKTVLAQALESRAGYIGMIGSKRKREAIYKALRDEGFTDADLERVYCPIGLPIETETPEEIAVSIVGQLIESRAEARR